jgi:hypothetical protein
MNRKVTITSQADLEQQWVDPNCPNMTFAFIEQDLEECLQGDGTYQASYQTLEVAAGETICFTYLTDSGEITYHLQPGEYGIKPN